MAEQRSSHKRCHSNTDDSASPRKYSVSSSIDIPDVEPKMLVGKDAKKLSKGSVYVWLAIAIAGNQLKRMTIALYNDLLPKTCENFRVLCTGQRGYGYVGTEFTRIIPHFMAQGGKVVRPDGSAGDSIYGGKFEDEGFPVRHYKRYLLSMANSGPNTNGSQFFITFDPCPWLDENHVVFGEIVDGFQVVDWVESFGSQEGEPLDRVLIVDSGQHGPEEVQRIKRFTERG